MLEAAENIPKKTTGKHFGFKDITMERKPIKTALNPE